MKRIPWRLGTALVLVFSMLGIAAPSPAAAQEGTASLTIHSRSCPENYDMSDVYNTCHDTVGDRGVEFFMPYVADAADIPDEAGNLTFSGLLPGFQEVSNTFPASLHQAYLWCSSNHQQSGFEGGTFLSIWETNSTRMYLSAGEDMTCDWYTAPDADFDNTRASLTIHTRWCPVGFSDFGKEWQTCMAKTTGNYWIDDPLPRYGFARGGNVTFSWLEPADYWFGNDIDQPAKIYCSTFDTIGMPFFEQELPTPDMVTLRLDAGDDVICDWYIYQTEDWAFG